MDIDVQSYFPELKRTLQMPDGETYLVRELQDLSIGAFNRLVDDEKQFGGGKDDKGVIVPMPLFERHQIERQHLQSLIVAVVTIRGVAPKGEKTLSIAGEGTLDLEPGDVVHMTAGLYFERNEVESVSEDKRSATMKSAWLFDGREGARVFRSIRPAVLDLLSYPQFMDVVVKVKSPEEPKAETKPEDGDVRPPEAASQSDSTTSSLP